MAIESCSHWCATRSTTPADGGGRGWVRCRGGPADRPRHHRGGADQRGSCRAGRARRRQHDPRGADAHHQPDHPGERVHPGQPGDRHPRRARHPRRLTEERAVRRRDRGQQRHRRRSRSCAPSARSTRCASSAPRRSTSSATARRSSSTSATSCSTTSSSCAPASRWWPTASCSTRTTWRSTSRCSPARPTRSSSNPATRCCPAAPSSPAAATCGSPRSAPQNYAAKLAEEAKRFTLVNSPLRNDVNRIVTWVGYAIIPVGLLLASSQFFRNDQGWQDAIISTVAGLVGMVPEGLVLLTSVAFAVGVVRLSKQRCLVQELPAIEVLARVDVLCADKTGTITEGSDGARRGRAARRRRRARGRRRAGRDGRARPRSERHPAGGEGALRIGHDTGGRQTGRVPFSSARKWSAMAFGDHGGWVLGAPEFVLGDAYAGDLQSNGRGAGRGRAPRSCCCASDGDFGDPAAPQLTDVAAQPSCCSRTSSAPTPPRRSTTSPTRASPSR